MLTLTNPPEEQEPSFETLASKFGFTAKRYGLKQLQAELDEIINDGEHPREFMEEAADQLLALNAFRPSRLVRQTSVLVRQAANQCPGLTDLRYYLHVDRHAAVLHQR